MKFKILNRRKLLDFRFKKPTMVISIVGVDEKQITLNSLEGKNTKNIVSFHKFCFDDVEKNFDKYKVITPQQARDILDCYLQSQDKAEICICQCEAGISRSAAVAAVLSNISNLDDSWVFDNDKYLPNMKVYRTILKEYIKRIDR